VRGARLHGRERVRDADAAVVVAVDADGVAVKPGADPVLVSHGDNSGPKRLRFSAEDGYQRRHGHGDAVFLSAF